MTQAQITTLKNNSVILPKTWKRARVFVRVTGDNATITKVPDSQKIFSTSEVRSLRELGSKVSKQALASAVKATRNR
ncbi:hypothetical protein A2947_01420 [Candidatus Peribacteria bacterium RIFCSPLOWO2_01_FULL_54_110]|nr:MAG: hypothetical protein A2947_01420 [Candidatus Peribacteria bacterium RIFCSPLOWO2_01_FULL_54_110]